MINIIYPQGSIKNLNELITAIEDHDILYKVYNIDARKWIEELHLYRGTKLCYEHDTYVLYMDRNGRYRCPGDFNVGRNHNQHFVFTNEANARAHFRSIKEAI